MKIIFLIIAHNDKNYDELQLQWKKYMNMHENIKSYFIKSSEQCTKPYIEDDTIYTEGHESLIPGILIKTVKSIQYLMDMNVEFDYIFRTNLSSVININKFYETILKLGNVDCAGVVGKHNNDRFLSGAGCLLSKKVCTHLVQTDTLNYTEFDDVAIGIFLNAHGYIFTPLQRCDYFINNNNVTNMNIINSNYHFRCKCTDYKMTVIVVKQLVRKLYDK